MNAKQALEIISDMAGRYGENVEEGFANRVDPDAGDDVCTALAERSGFEPDEVMEIRDLWKALEYVQDMLKQRGCEGFDPAVQDGKMTTLIDVIVCG